MSTTPQFNHEQLAAARNARWHQAAGQPAGQPGDPLLTLEAARDWIAELGLVLFAPRAQQLPAPAPSFVEATLGHAAPTPTAAETDTARSLLARLTAEGAAIPLNLLGGPGDVPDFIVSTPVFGYIFTLRGDKAWKQPPATSGAVKVSPLALKVYEALSQGNAMSAAEIADELGREVTENAILRALNELWSQLRVLPLHQQDGSATLWELTTRRFTKQLKSGANAGQPTALSALISLYLAQVYAALEEEIETFLSPLAARSRVRDVLHGLTAGRQLEGIVLEGKRLLYIPGALPEFPEIAVEQPAEGEAGAETAASSGEAKPEERIRRFDRPRRPREERPGTSGEERPRPFSADRPPRSFRGDRPARPARDDRERPRKPFGERAERGERNDRPRPAREGRERGERKSFGDRERRPFQRDRAKPERPSFTRPWDEDRKPRERSEQGERPRRDARPHPEGERPRGEGNARAPFPRKEFRPRTDRSKRPFGEGGANRSDRPDRPFRPRSQEGEGTRPPRRAEDERPRREGSARPSTGRKDFRPRPDRGERPPREGGANRSGRPDRPFRPRPQLREGTRPQKRFRREDENGGEARADAGNKRSFGSKPAGRRDFAKKPFGAKPFAKKPFGKPAFGKRASGDAGPPRGPSDSRPLRGVNPRKANRSGRPNQKPNPPRETEE